VIENEAGIYFDFNDPVITEPSVLVAEFSTGVEEHGAEVMIIFPNPTMGIITLTGAELIDARVLSLDGKLLYTARSATKPIATIDLSGLSPGTYLLEGKSADGNRRTVRFTKL
ncbi:MAG: T9SS type A sorting domain-containing protein, partial [Flavobacteriales bacterium]|nr:T9SS type A sorting domain-containing protein [Flavobacteriales bacterium]